MKLKSIVIGDIVELKANYIENYLDKANNKMPISLEVIDVVSDDEDISIPEKYIYRDMERDYDEVPTFMSTKNKLVVKTPVFEELAVNSNVHDLFSFNAKGSSVLKKMLKCNARLIEKNFLAIEGEGDSVELTFIPYTKLRFFNGSNMYNKELREKYAQKIKPIKFISELFKANGISELLQSEIDDLISCFKKEIDADFEIVEGKDITRYYNYSKYATIAGEETGTLWNSCMRHDKCNEYFGLYEDNCKMLILKQRGTGKIYGRAILWNLEGSSDFKGKVLMDRIYVVKDYMVGLFKDFADKNDWFHLESQSLGTYTFEKRDKTYTLEETDECYVELVKSPDSYEYFPYIDTFYLEYCDYDNRLFTCCDESDEYYDEDDEEYYSDNPLGYIGRSFHETDGSYYER